MHLGATPAQTNMIPQKSGLKRKGFGFAGTIIASAAIGYAVGSAFKRPKTGLAIGVAIPLAGVALFACGMTGGCKGFWDLYDRVRGGGS